MGVLALQGAVSEHIQMLQQCKADAIEVRDKSDLAGCRGLVIPGGESTAISQLLHGGGLAKEIVKMHKNGLALFGTCAGAILLAKKVFGCKKVKPLKLLDISIRRNAYGRQIDSFEAELDVKGFGKYKGVFIRAPIIESAGKKVEVLAEFKSKPVLVRRQNILVSTFHPELAADKRIHEFFVKMAAGKA